jgi:hypothetical protein
MLLKVDGLGARGFQSKSCPSVVSIKVNSSSSSLSSRNDNPTPCTLNPLPIDLLPFKSGRFLNFNPDPLAYMLLLVEVVEVTEETEEDLLVRVAAM